MPNPADLAQPPTSGGAVLGRVRQVIAGLGCTPAECIALAVLVAGAVAALGLLWLSSRPGPAPSAATAPEGGVTIEADEVVVHLAGAVTAPGLYRLPGGARVGDGLAAAGGPLPDAALDGLNLARPLTDGEQIIVPTMPAPGAAVQVPAAPANGQPAAGDAQPAAPSAIRPDGTLDLNRATPDDLDELPGIGPILAERIVAHREQAGPFTSVGQLRDVPGIGEKIFQKLAPLVAVG